MSTTVHLMALKWPMCWCAVKKLLSLTHSSYTLLAWSLSLRDMVLSLIYMLTIRRYRAIVALGLPISSSPPCQLAWTKCLTGCGRIVYSWTLRNQKSSGVRPLVSRTICHLLLFASERTMCCPRQLFVTLEFSSTAMSLCSPMCLVRCPDISLCYDSSAASVSDSVFHSLVMPRLDYCNATLTGLPASHPSRLQSVLNAVARLIHRPSRYEHVTPILRDLHWLWSPERIDFKLAVLTYRCLHDLAWSFRLYPERRRFQRSPSPVVVILAASDPTYTAVHCWWSCISGCRMPPLEQSAARHHLSFNAVCFSKLRQNSSLFLIISFLTVFRFLVLHTV